MPTFSDASGLYVGTSAVTAVYMGGTSVWTAGGGGTTPPPTSDRGPSGKTVIWEHDPDDGLDVGIWMRLQNNDTANSSQGSEIQYWPNGSATRTTLPAGSSYDGIGKAIRFELRNGDIAANGHRSELSGDGAGWQFHEGDERWLQYRIKFDAAWKPGTTGDFNLITQMHAGSGSPPLSIQVRDDGALMLEDANTAKDNNSAAGIGWKVILPGSEWYAKRGTWMDLNLHVKFSNTIDNGGAQVFIDGVERVPWHKRQTMASSRCYLKIGNYRHDQPETNIVYFDDLRLTSP